MSDSRFSLAPSGSAPGATPTEVAIRVGLHSAQARRSRFHCQIAAGPDGRTMMTRSMDGWDVYIQGRWLMGGLQVDPVSGATRPRFPRVADAVIALLQHDPLTLWPQESEAREGLPADGWGLQAA